MEGSKPLDIDQLRVLIKRIKERLWIRPLVVCLFSAVGVFMASMADDAGLSSVLPEISRNSVESLLTIMASSMMVIATFAVGSMVAAYASASTGATPRSFSLVLADDVSQNALSAFVGAFIFSLISLVAVQNEMFGAAGLFAIFALTVFVFVIVIAMFMRWVDRIARLGRVPNTIQKVETAAAAALDRRRHSPALGGVPAPRQGMSNQGTAIFSSTVGYVQHIDMGILQACAESLNCRVSVAALPGTFVSMGRPLLRVTGNGMSRKSGFEKAFTVGRERSFEDDPRFGLLALSEIADKALSPGINDPGTAITILGSMVRLFTLWQCPLEGEESLEIHYDRVSVPQLEMSALFDDAFNAIARDGAGIVEVSVRLQKALVALANSGNRAMAATAIKHSQMALTRSEQAMTSLDDIQRARQASLVTGY